jgi:hypothetical protein
VPTKAALYRKQSKLPPPGFENHNELKDAQVETLAVRKPSHPAQALGWVSLRNAMRKQITSPAPLKCFENTAW